MSDTPSRPGTERSSDGRTDATELPRLLPPPAHWDLPRERHLHHKELLMQQIDHDLDSARTTEAAPAPRRTRRPRPAVLASLTALALAGALTAGLATRGGGHGTAVAPRAGAPAAQQASTLLDRISDVALAGDATPVRDDQFVYVKSMAEGADETSGTAVPGTLHTREIWSSQAQGPVKRMGLVREEGETLPVNAPLGDTDGTPPGFSRATYRWLASLPTDPKALLAYLYAHTPGKAGQERDQAVFGTIGGLIDESVMPPRTAAALYKAAALIPGVVTDPGATDVTGRHGVGVRRDDTRYGQRTEWVFDANDLSYLGSRTYLLKDTGEGRKGTMLSADSVLERAVVDKEGEQPTAAQVRRPRPATAQG
ncbi:CU044_5270 family protein [Streptomyces sp. NBC_00448]|uniref:CU044_5270 family protein n=1 Tax=Streptomyces sp. NBC_00448 TaxID=2903652 RepID=UPI002E20660C